MDGCRRVLSAPTGLEVPVFSLTKPKNGLRSHAKHHPQLVRSKVSSIAQVNDDIFPRKRREPTYIRLSEETDLRPTTGEDFEGKQEDLVDWPGQIQRHSHSSMSQSCVRRLHRCFFFRCPGRCDR